jgi:beta-glucanase (GH16 family)
MISLPTLVRGAMGLSSLLLGMLLSVPSYAAAPTRLAFSSAAQTIPLGNCASIQVVTESMLMQIAPVTVSTTVSVSGGSGYVGFFSDAACTEQSTSVVIPAGHSSGSVYISGSKQGSYLLTVRATSLSAATQTETISAPPPPACSGSQAAPTAAPAQAAAAGFTNLVFDDEFNSSGTISPNDTGTYNWYTWNPFSAALQLPVSDTQVSNGCLTIQTDLSGYSAGLLTINSTNPAAGTFQHGYFEARMQFYPAGSQGGAWPAFWSYALEGIQGQPQFSELDFIEAYPGGAGGATYGNNGVTLLTTVHQWTGSHSTQQANDVPTLPQGFNYDAFHIYGCLWSTNSVTWYIDNQPVMTVATGPGTSFTALEQDHVFLALGTGKNWPAIYDYVHVWH